MQTSSRTTRSAAWLSTRGEKAAALERLGLSTWPRSERELEAAPATASSLRSVPGFGVLTAAAAEATDLIRSLIPAGIGAEVPA
jgi:hypothetical protein